MSEIKNENESESSEISNEDDKNKNGDILSSSDEENNQNQNNNNNKINSNNNIENPKYLGNKRSASKDVKEINDFNDNRKKIKKYNNSNYMNDKKIFQPSLDIPLITYELFCELYNEKVNEKNISNDGWGNSPQNDLKKLYEDYKLKHEQKNNEQFFEHHKKDEWFMEKYHPYKYVQFNEKERNEMCQKKAKIFFDLYDVENMINKKDNKEDANLTQKFNYIFDLKEEHEYNKNIKILYTKVNLTQNKFEEIERDLNNIPLSKEIIQKELEEDGKPYYFYNPDYLTLYNLTSLTKNIEIIQIINLFKKYAGFVSLSLTEPERINGYKRSFWVSFDNENNCQNALNSLKEYELGDFLIKLIKSETSHNLHSRKIKITPPLFEERLNEDIIGSNKIIKILDNYREIISNPLIEKINIEELPDLNEGEKINILNLNILYLRKIYGFCYYCLKSFKDERNLTKKCDFLHLRHYIKLGKRDDKENILKNNENNLSEEELINAIEFDKSFTNKLSELLNDKEKINSLILLRPKYLINDEFSFDKLENEKKEFIKENSEQLEPKKFECKICKKKFVAFNYIENHMKNKHLDKMNDYAENNVNEILMEENFKEDKEKFSKSNIITNKEDYEDYLIKLDSSKNNNYNYTSTYDHHKKYKDWDDPSNFQSSKNPYIKILYDDL
jgi:hypothetical protein